ncbi:MAG: hypothetical protein LBV55_01250, partial [Acholeplasmatales bacterium]|nr:hypothetical protein [Acholeplasmatales bacterium]
METNKDYIIGLDLGAGSVGWAVTDEDYTLLKKSGKHLWGVRLFDEAESAKGRRKFRRQRRSLNKRNWRLHLLRVELKEYVLAEDPDFYNKLKKSSDKREDSNKFTLFNDINYNDKDFYKEFPTIYHLRLALLNEVKAKEFLKRNLYYRFLFLVINDILKNRGHFNSKNIKFTDQGNIAIESIYNEIKDLVNKINIYNDEQETGIEFNYDEIIKKIENPANFNSRLSDPNTLFVKIIKGYKFNFSKLYSTDKEEKIELDLTDEDFDNKMESIVEHREDLESLNLIYSYLKINSILKDSTSISDAKVKVFQNFHENIGKLKQVVREIDQLSKENYYDLIFRDTKEKISLLTRYLSKNKDLSKLSNDYSNRKEFK